MTEFAKTCKAFILDIFLPNRCPVCGRIIKWDLTMCPECDKNTSKANDIICRKCGRINCLCGNDLYDLCFASLFYNDKGVRSAILRLKNDGATELTDYAAKDLALHMEKEHIPKPDIIVPVPMGKKKRRRKGFDHSNVFAKCVGKCLDIPVRNDILFKRDNKVEQHNCTAEERMQRVAELFYSADTDLNGMTVMLCDDVMTTGATVNMCAGLLKELGAEKVIAALCAVTELDTTTEEGA